MKKLFAKKSPAFSSSPFSNVPGSTRRNPFARTNLDSGTAPSAPRFWWWAFWGALLGTAFVLFSFAPASWLASGIASISNQKVILAEPRGTVWNGSARLLLTGGKGSADAVLLPDRVTWRARLAGLGLQLGMKPECCAQMPVRFWIKPGIKEHTVLIEQLDVTLPASMLAGLGTPFNTLGFDGNVSLRSRQLDVNIRNQQFALKGDAVMQLQRLSSSLSTLPELGNYTINISGGDMPRVKLLTDSGALVMTGDGQWQNGRFGFNGEARAAPGYEGTLANILNIIGRRDGERTILKL